MLQKNSFVYTGPDSWDEPFDTGVILKYTYLAPYQHASKHNLQPVKEVLPDHNDHGTAGGPALAGADGFDARSCWTGQQSGSYCKGFNAKRTPIQRRADGIRLKVNVFKVLLSLKLFSWEKARTKKKDDNNNRKQNINF